MIMKGYSSEFEKGSFAMARVEDANVSYKDLTQVCGRIRGKDAEWATTFLEMVSTGEIPVLYKRHNKRLGHRRELGGKKGRYPKKAAKAILKVLESAVANGKSRGMGDKYDVVHAAANKKNTFGRIAPKGRWARSDYETARIEIVLKPLETIPKGVSVKAPEKTEKPESKKPEKIEAKKPEKKEEKKEIVGKTGGAATPAVKSNVHEVKK